jgi:hypothetical protein
VQRECICAIDVSVISEMQMKKSSCKNHQEVSLSEKKNNTRRKISIDRTLKTNTSAKLDSYKNPKDERRYRFTIENLFPFLKKYYFF